MKSPFIDVERRFNVASGKYVVKGGKNAQDVAKLFAADYHDLVGKSLTPKTGKPSAGDIVLVLQSDKKSARQLGKEGYRLTIQLFKRLKHLYREDIFVATAKAIVARLRHADTLLPEKNC